MGILHDIKPQSKRPTPLEIEAGKTDLSLAWSDGHRTSLPFRYLREKCPCAGCVDEWTGRRTLNPSTIPADIRPLELSPVGRYALQISWSDGHNSGIYSWDLLLRLESEFAQAKGP